MKIKREDVEIVKLTSRELILSLFDLSTPFFLASRMYHTKTRDYLEKRSEDRSQILTKIKYLKSRKYIRSFVEGKEQYLELTAQGKTLAKHILLDELTITRPKLWDKNWRVIIFDIPETMRHERDIFRDRIKRLDFVQIQKSVYVYPFECAKEVKLLSETLRISKYVTIMISQIIQGEDHILRFFIDENVLTNKDLGR